MGKIEEKQKKMYIITSRKVETDGKHAKKNVNKCLIITITANFGAQQKYKKKTTASFSQRRFGRSKSSDNPGFCAGGVETFARTEADGHG